MRTVFLLSLAGEFVREELHRVHRLDEIVHVMLRKVTSVEKLPFNTEQKIGSSSDYAHPQPAVVRDMTSQRLQIPHQELDPIRRNMS